MNSGDHPESYPELVTAPQTAKKKRRLKRAFSRSLKHGAPDKKHRKTSDPHPPLVPTPQSQAIRENTITRGAARKLSKADLERELKRVLSENALLKSQLDSANKSLAISETKRAQATASHLASQSKARESQKALKNVETVVQLQAKQISIAHKESATMVQEAVERQKRKHQVSDICSSIPFFPITISPISCLGYIQQGTRN